jgi:membrane-associated phospholipid phosphatase
MSAHGWRLLSSLGIDAGAAIYGKHFGPSNEPLLFEDVPGFDAAVHATLSKGTPSPTYLGLYGLETIKYASWLAIIGIDLGNRHEMAGDIFGAAESFFMNRGLTSLGKDVVGRVRPDLQYADPKALGRAEFLALRAEPDEYRSFPSGHASGSFTWAAYLDRVIARKVGMRSAARKLAFAALYGAAGYIGYTRIREGEHYFSDIVAGAGLGIWVSRSNYRAEHPEEFGQRENRRPARLRFYPPRIFHGGAAWTLGIRLGVDRS